MTVRLCVTGEGACAAPAPTTREAADAEPTRRSALRRMRPESIDAGRGMTRLPESQAEAFTLPAALTPSHLSQRRDFLSRVSLHCLAKKRCADNHLASVARQCLYLAFPWPLPCSRPAASACPASRTKKRERRLRRRSRSKPRDPFYDVRLNAASASARLSNLIFQSRSTAAPSPSTRQVAACQEPSTALKIATRDSSCSSPGSSKPTS